MCPFEESIPHSTEQIYLLVIPHHSSLVANPSGAEEISLTMVHTLLFYFLFSNEPSFSRIFVLARPCSRGQIRAHASACGHERPRGDRPVLVLGVREHGAVRHTLVDAEAPQPPDHSVSGQAVQGPTVWGCFSRSGGTPPVMHPDSPLPKAEIALCRVKPYSPWWGTEIRPKKGCVHFFLSTAHERCQRPAVWVRPCCARVPVSSCTTPCFVGRASTFFTPRSCSGR